MKIGFIGCGNMGGALATAVSKASHTELYLSDHNCEKAKALAEKLGGIVADNETIAESCDIVFLGVKPNMLCDVVTPLATLLCKNSDSVIITMAAGVRIDRLATFLGHSHKIIRIMPNTPVIVGEGMITWCDSGNLTAEDETTFKKILSHAGSLDKIDEDSIDAATAVAGCGPAFVYMFIDALAKGGEACGLSRSAALGYACQTLRGAASMVEQMGKSPEQLKIDVCSPGGSTIEGVKVLENGGLDNLCISAVSASFEKNKQLGK